LQKQEARLSQRKRATLLHFRNNLCVPSVSTSQNYSNTQYENTFEKVFEKLPQIHLSKCSWKTKYNKLFVFSKKKYMLIVIVNTRKSLSTYVWILRLRCHERQVTENCLVLQYLVKRRQKCVFICFSFGMFRQFSNFSWLLLVTGVVVSISTSRFRDGLETC